MSETPEESASKEPLEDNLAGLDIGHGKHSVNHDARRGYPGGTPGTRPHQRHEENHDDEKYSREENLHMHEFRMTRLRMGRATDRDFVWKLVNRRKQLRSRVAE